MTEAVVYDDNIGKNIDINPVPSKSAKEKKPRVKHSNFFWTLNTNYPVQSLNDPEYHAIRNEFINALNEIFPPPPNHGKLYEIVKNSEFLHLDPEFVKAVKNKPFLCPDVVGTAC